MVEAFIILAICIMGFVSYVVINKRTEQESDVMSDMNVELKPLGVVIRRDPHINDEVRMFEIEGDVLTARGIDLIDLYTEVIHQDWLRPYRATFKKFQKRMERL